MASGMILIIIGIRILGRKRTPRGLVLGLWNLVLLRGLLPFRISLGEIPIWDHTGNSLSKWNHQKELVRVLELMGSKAGTSLASRKQIILGSSHVQLEMILEWIWVAGMICLLFYFMYTYAREYQAFKRCVPVQNEIAKRLIRKRNYIRNIRLYEGEAFKTPVTYGVLFPKIVLPKGLDTASRMDLRNMIVHELEHIRKFDVLKRYLLAAFLCLHWFNPLAWIMYRLYQEDQEIACDERVLRRMKKEKGKHYIYTMIKMSVDEKRHFAATGFGGKSVGKRRILAALNPKRLKVVNLMIIMSVGICMSLVFVSVTPVRIRQERKVNDTGEGIAEEIKPEEGPIQLIEPVFEDNSKFIWYDEDFDFEGIMQDIIENYNDPTQPLTAEQAKAVSIQNYLVLGAYYKGLLEQGIDLKTDYKSNAIWMISEYGGKYENE